LQWSIAAADIVGEARLPRALRARVNLAEGSPTTFRSCSLRVGARRSSCAVRLVVIRAIDALSRERGVLAAHLCGGQLDAIVDLSVAGAAAEFPRSPPYLVARRARVLREQLFATSMKPGVQ
jgi:hypothetical protein